MPFFLFLTKKFLSQYFSAEPPNVLWLPKLDSLAASLLEELSKVNLSKGQLALTSHTAFSPPPNEK